MPEGWPQPERCWLERCRLEREALRNIAEQLASPHLGLGYIGGEPGQGRNQRHVEPMKAKCIRLEAEEPMMAGHIPIEDKPWKLPGVQKPGHR